MPSLPHPLQQADQRRVFKGTPSQGASCLDAWNKIRPHALIRADGQVLYVAASVGVAVACAASGSFPQSAMRRSKLRIGRMMNPLNPRITPTAPAKTIISPIPAPGPVPTSHPNSSVPQPPACIIGSKT